MRTFTRIGLAGVLAATVVGCSSPQGASVVPPAGAATNAGPTIDPGITVSGEGEVTGTPDTLTINFGVSLKRANVDEAVSEAAAKSSAIVDALRSRGVEDKDIQTANYSINTSFRFSEGTQIPDGFQISQSVTVKVRDLKNAGSVIGDVTKAGGNDVTVQGVSFDLEDDTAAIDKAREHAWNNAKAKAEQLAKLSGRELGLAESITDAVDSSQKFMQAGAALDSATTSSGAVPNVNPGQVITKVTVMVRFALR